MTARTSALLGALHALALVACHPAPANVPILPEPRGVTSCAVDAMERRDRECSADALAARALDHVRQGAPMPSCITEECEIDAWIATTVANRNLADVRRRVGQ